MISTEEKRYLYWLGRSAWSGRGDVVEIGPWLGGSTVCLAAGMRASGHDARGRLHVFDNFIWRRFMSRRAPLPIEPGDSFEPYFHENVRDYADVVDASARALPDEAIESDREAAGKRFAEGERIPVLDALPGGSVEIVFIDGAKSWRGMRHLLGILRDRLIPGTSLIVCQDFKYWGTYWVPAMMMRLGDRVTPVHNVHSATTVTFRLDAPIAGEFVDGLEDHVRELETEATLAALDRASALLFGDGDGLGAANVSLGRVSFLSHQDRVDRAVEEFRSIEARWPVLEDDAQLEIARDYLRAEKSRAVPRARRTARAALPRRVWRKTTSAWSKRFG
jgi:predicted O-methyltransferase YrrM